MIIVVSSLFALFGVEVVEQRGGDGDISELLAAPLPTERYRRCEPCLDGL